MWPNVSSRQLNWERQFRGSGALTDPTEFGQWFRVKLDGPFKPGAVSMGMMTYPGYEHCPWRAVIEHMDHERLLSFRWHDFDETSGVDIS